jgi:UDP-3-O-acyl-N-acetylglucosamine deacetylase
MVMANQLFGRVLLGDAEGIARSWDRCQAQPVDWDLSDTPLPEPDERQRTISRPAAASGHGTFFRRAIRELALEPTDREGWWFSRTDQPKALPMQVAVGNVWTTGSVVSNIVLRAGPPENYMRMVEHIVALKLGLGLDNLMIRVQSGDPPIFERGSLDLVEALESAGASVQDRPVRYWTVREPVTVGGPHGSFLTFAPPSGGRRRLFIDCAVDFVTAIGRQRIRFPLTYGLFRQGAEARTNTTLAKIVYSFTIGRLFADIRHMGYNRRNVVIASRFGYFNRPRLVHNGKSLEAVWHRAALDLLAAIALMERGRFVGDVTSYKAGHWLDVQMMRALYQQDLLTPA